VDASRRIQAAADAADLFDDGVTEIPERMAIEIKRAVASDCEEQPPARPVLVNTSQILSSSALTLT
jgi:hypothetical protein